MKTIIGTKNENTYFQLTKNQKHFEDVNEALELIEQAKHILYGVPDIFLKDIELQVEPIDPTLNELQAKINVNELFDNIENTLTSCSTKICLTNQKLVKKL